MIENNKDNPVSLKNVLTENRFVAKTEDGTESADIRVRYLDDFITFEKEVLLLGSDAASSSKYSIFYVPNLRCYVLEARMRHGKVGGASAAVQIEKLTDQTALGSGTKVLADWFDLTAQVNKIQWQVATSRLSAIQLGPGDALALRPSGTLTGASDVCVGVLFGIHCKDIPTGQSISTTIVGL